MPGQRPAWGRPCPLAERRSDDDRPGGERGKGETLEGRPALYLVPTQDLVKVRVVRCRASQRGTGRRRFGRHRGGRGGPLGAARAPLAFRFVGRGRTFGTECGQRGRRPARRAELRAGIAFGRRSVGDRLRPSCRGRRGAPQQEAAAEGRQKQRTHPGEGLERVTLLLRLLGRTTGAFQDASRAGR